MVEPGLESSVQETVTDESTADRIGSGDVAVLGTPAVLALVERAAVAALAGALDKDMTSVGTRVELDHLAPTPVGGSVTATARLQAVEGHRLRFSFDVRDGSGPIARGTHERVVVDRNRFLAAATERREPGPT